MSCMGGWCPSRGSCANYHDTTGEPHERLCAKGETNAYQPIRILPPMPPAPRPVETVEVEMAKPWLEAHNQARRAASEQRIYDAIAETGSTAKEIAGMCSNNITDVHQATHRMIEQGRVFVTKQIRVGYRGTPKSRYFKSEADMTAWLASPEGQELNPENRESKYKLDIENKAAQRKAERAERERERYKKRKIDRKARAMSRQNEAIAEMIRRGKKMAEERIEGKKARGPAGLPGDPDMSKAKVVDCTILKSRFQVPEDFKGAFGSLKPGQYPEEAGCCAARVAAV